MQNNPVPNPAGQNQTLAIVSLVLGIASIVVCAGLTGPPAIITGLMAKKKANNDPASFGGAGLATGGIVTGIVGSLILLLVLAYVVLMFVIVGAGMLNYSTNR